MQTKTLGGDRLGSGKKMKVELHGYERSTHDMGFLWRSTMSAGTLVPFLVEVALPGDTFDINLDCEINTHPTIGPLFGSFKVQLDCFVCPIRLYQGLLHNNKLGIGLNMANVKLPQMELNATAFDAEEVDDVDNAQINPSSILAYLGIRGVGMTAADSTRLFNATSLLALWDIYKNYYANKQEEIGAVIHTPIPALGMTPTSIDAYRTGAPGGLTGPIPEQSTGTTAFLIEPGGGINLNLSSPTPVPLLNQIILNLTNGKTMTVEQFKGNTTANLLVTTLNVPYDFQLNGTFIEIASWRLITTAEMIIGPPVVETFPLDNIDDMREYLLVNLATSPVEINNANLTPYSWILGASNGFNHMLSNQEGLPVKTYQSDLFNNWLQTEWIDGVNGISAVTAIDTSSGEFTIDTLNLAKKVYDMLNRIAVSGGTYDDWLDVQYDHPRFTRAETPIYIGGLIKELVFQEVVSNAASQADASQPLGTLAGKGIMSSKHKGGKIIAKIDEPSYVIGLISLTPRIDYSQGNEWDVHLETMADLHVPALDQIGFQELITERMAWWATHRNASTGLYETTSAGKQPAWIEYMTNVNKTFGNFAIANNEMFMTLNRRYEPSPGIAMPIIDDLTTYIDPTKCNHIFAQTALDAQNFWVQISVDNTGRRKMSAKLMPNV